MPGRIPSQFIDELMRRVDIVDVIGARVPLKRAGREYQALCPFHDERTPSFTVSPAKQFYHCFGCGAHGTALRFLMEYEGLDFVDAVEELAGQLGLEVPREGGAREPSREDSAPLYALMAACADFFRRQYRASGEAQAYVERRGLDAAIVQRYGLGWSGRDWDQLLRALGSGPREREQLLRLGMLVSGERGNLYDRFRDRLMFPIHDRRGRVIAFGGRIVGEGTPKYLNSPETPLFHKGRELYGLHLARQGGSRVESLLVVEGYMDVIALAQHGIVNAVATLGTATTREHAELLFRSAPEVVFCFDGDRAGLEAAWRAVESVLPRMRDGRSARFLFLPEGEDPDTLVRAEGAEGFRQRLAAAEPLSEFFFRHHVEKAGGIASLEARAKLAEAAAPMLARMPDGAFRDLMRERLDQLAGVPVRVAAPPSSAPKPAPRSATHEPAVDALVHALLVRLVQQPAIADEAQWPLAFAGLELPGIELLIELLELCHQRAAVDPARSLRTAGLIEHYRGTPMADRLELLAMQPLAGDAAGQRAEFREGLARLTKRALEQRLASLKALAQRKALEEHERQELRALLRQLARPGHG